jgi:hypothetical protein
LGGYKPLKSYKEEIIMYCIISYETTDFEVVTQICRGGRVQGMYHCKRRARYFEQTITAFRVIKEGLTFDEARALIRSASPMDGVRIAIS